MTDFSEIYRRYAPDVFRFALYLSGNRGDAEDITSETFVRPVGCKRADQIPDHQGLFVRHRQKSVPARNAETVATDGAS